MTVIDTDPRQELERAQSDYLAVSRGAHLYASADEHRRAEERTWDRLQAARDAVTALEAPTV